MFSDVLTKPGLFLFFTAQAKANRQTQENEIHVGPYPQRRHYVEAAYGPRCVSLAAAGRQRQWLVTEIGGLAQVNGCCHVITAGLGLFVFKLGA